MKLSLKAYESSTTNVRLFVYSGKTFEFSLWLFQEQRLQMRPLFRSPYAKSGTSTAIGQ